ncbi:MAG: CBS domain-containing protein [Verrucomicrobiae bacterium]|nr:CBS domain-containing protein [Verrucomicrobiae bacterium]
MAFTGTVSAVLQQKKHSAVYSVGPDQTVFEAIGKMAEYNVGALVVVENGRLMGMISERDYTRKVALQGKSSKETRVREILTFPVITVTPTTTVEECLRLMTQHRIRHLPVLEKDQLVGVLSIGDLVNWIITTQSQVIEQLTHYISGSY